MASKFENVNLADVDPGQAEIPNGKSFTFQVLGGTLKTFEYKSGERQGQEGEYIQGSFAITGDPDFSGRRVWMTFFPGKGTDKQLRILMDATGIPQDGMPYVEYLNLLKTSGAQFSAPVKVEEKQDKTTGEMRKNVSINFWECKPA